MLSVAVAFLAVATCLTAVTAQTTDDTDVKNAILKVTCPRGGGAVVIQLDPDYALNYAHYVGLLDFPATMFYLNADETPDDPDQCTPSGAMFALQFSGPGTLDATASTYTLTGAKILDAGQAMVAASDAINNALNSDLNKEATNLIDALNSDGDSGLGQDFADSITPTPELVSAASFLQSLTTVTPVPIVAQADAPISRIRARSNRLAAREAALIALGGELATEGEIAGGAAAIPVAGEAVIAVVTVVAVLQILTAVLPDPNKLRSFSDEITYKTTLVAPWIVFTPAAPSEIDSDVPGSQCDLHVPDAQLPREKKLPSKGPCDVYLKNILWNQPKVDWSKEIGADVDYNAAESKIRGTVVIKCKPTGSKKWMTGKYWHRLYPATTDVADSGSHSSSSNAPGAVSDSEVQIPDLGITLPPNFEGEAACQPSRDWQAKPYFTVDIGGEYTMAGEASLEFNFAMTTSISGGSFKMTSGTPGFSENTSGNGVGGIEIYGIKAQGDQLYANAGLKIAAGIKYLRDNVEVWDLSTTLNPGIWISGVQEVVNDQITISTRTVAAATSNTPSTFSTVFTSTSTAQEAPTASTDSAVPTTTVALTKTESACVVPLSLKAFAKWEAAIKFMGKQIFMQEIIPASVANKWLTFKWSPAQACLKKSGDFPS